MRKLLPHFVIVICLVSSCKKSEPDPQPVTWDEDFGYFTGMLVNSSDTMNLTFTTSQSSTFCLGGCWSQESVNPWEDKARYWSAVEGICKFQLIKNMLFFESSGWLDVPEDAAFINYFQSGDDSLVDYDISNYWDQGYDIRFTDQNGNVYTSAFNNNYGNSNYEVRIENCHPFFSNGIQYVKVRMVFNNIHLVSSVNNYTMINCRYEGFFKNQQ